MENFKKNLMGKKAQGLRPFVISLVVLIFLVLVMVFIFQRFLAIQNPTSPILNNGILNNAYNNLSNQLSVFSNTVCKNNSGGNCSDTDTSLFGVLSKSDPTPVDYLFLIFKGAFTIPWTLLSFSFSGIVTITQVLFSSLGIGVDSGIIGLGVGLLISGLVLTAIFYIVSAIRTGNSERN